MTCLAQPSPPPNENSSSCANDITRIMQLETIPGAQLLPGQTTLPANVYPNGRPTYTSQVYNPETDEGWMLGSGALAAVRGQHSNVSWSLNFASVPSCPTGPLGGTCNPDDGTHTPSWRILSNLNNGGAANSISVSSSR